MDGLTGCTTDNLSTEERDLRMTRLMSSLSKGISYPPTRSIGVQTLIRTSNKNTQTPRLYKNRYDSYQRKYPCKTGKNWCRSQDCSSQCTGNIEDEDERYVCRLCSRRFSEKCVMERHSEMIHEGEWNYECSTCGLLFKLKERLEKHVDVHRDEKPHVCKHCGKAFKWKNGLSVHLEVHIRERPYSCSQCGHGFARLSSLKKHTVNVHTKAK